MAAATTLDDGDVFCGCFSRRFNRKMWKKEDIINGFITVLTLKQQYCNY